MTGWLVAVSVAAFPVSETLKELPGRLLTEIIRRSPNKNECSLTENGLSHNITIRIARRDTIAMKIAK